MCFCIGNCITFVASQPANQGSYTLADQFNSHRKLSWLTGAAKPCKYPYLFKLQALQFTVWCFRGNPDGLFDFHLGASRRLPPRSSCCVATGPLHLWEGGRKY